MKPVRLFDAQPGDRRDAVAWLVAFVEPRSSAVAPRTHKKKQAEALRQAWP